MSVLKRSVTLCFVLAGLCVVSPTASCGAPMATDAPRSALDFDNRPLEEFQVRLLDVAFRTASSYPLNPHVKNRSRAQEKVVKACLELDQPVRALEYIPQIANWRRGAGYAYLARHLVGTAAAEHVERFLALALKHAENPGQAWRRARVKTLVAQTRAMMGQAEAAYGMLDVEHDPAAVAEVVGSEVTAATDEEYEPLADRLNGLIASEEFDKIKGAMFAYADVYNRYYENAELRARIEQQVRASWTTIPITFRIGALRELTEAALAHDDADHALELIEEAEDVRRQYRWDLEHELSMRAELIKLRFRAGDRQTARRQLDEALKLFHARLENTKNHDRAGMLRPLAEAYQVIGEGEQSLEVYRLAVDQGALNPNIRPRTDDLTATCVSMALHHVEPDDKLWRRIREIHQGLVAK